MILVWFTWIPNIHSVNLARLRSIKNDFHSEICLMEPDVSLWCISHDQSSAVVKSDVPIPKTPFHPIPLRSVLLHLKMERDQTSLFCKASSPWAVVQIYYPHHLCSFETLAKAWKWQNYVAGSNVPCRGEYRSLKTDSENSLWVGNCLHSFLLKLLLNCYK